MSRLLASWSEDRASCLGIVHDPHQASHATNQVRSGPPLWGLDPGPVKYKFVFYLQDIPEPPNTA